MVNTICLFHNGNNRIIDSYKNEYSNLDFVGNWACHNYRDNSLYEISNCDATVENLFELRSRGVKIIRHITTLEDDIKHKIDELESLENWHHDVVCHNLCFADTIKTDYVDRIEPEVNETALITTGRAASKHLRLYLGSMGIMSYEGGKLLDNRLRQTHDSILLWREDLWELLCSMALSFANGFKHNIEDKPHPEYNQSVILDLDWINRDIWNMCQNTLDIALYYKYIIQKPIVLATTENIVRQYKSKSHKIVYQKDKLILNYEQMRAWFEDTNFEHNMNMLYNNTVALIGGRTFG